MADKTRRGEETRLPEHDRPEASTSSPLDPSLIAQRAYERYQQRGGEHGRDQQDWFEAERELIAAQFEQDEVESQRRGSPGPATDRTVQVLRLAIRNRALHPPSARAGR